MPSVKEVKRALARIKSAIPAQKQVVADYRNIRLGLERITRIVPDEQPWTGVHVGGTNGKGSIVALLAGMFRHAGLSHGTFMSPAIPERHNGVTINGLYVNKRMYEQEIKHVEATFKRKSAGWTFTTGEDPGDLTPFELETAAAFRVFTKMHVKYGIVEVGMGGATDATNAMKQKGVTVISKIDLDHQEYLGNTIEEIAKVKAGIMRPGVPCIVDHTNPDRVLDVLRKHAQTVGTQIKLSQKALPLLTDLNTEKFILEDYEQQNLLCATLAFNTLFPHLQVDFNRLLASRPQPAGRKELVSVAGLTNGLREENVLVDGAHNMLGVEALAKYVNGRVRKDEQPVTWIMGLSASKSKPFAKMIETLIRPHDNFAFVEYIPGANDPQPAPAELGREIGRAALNSDEQVYEGAPSISSAMQWATSKAQGGPILVTGSLYLIRQFYSLDGVEQTRKIKTRRPGRAQLAYYSQLAQQRQLTEDEERQYKQARRHWYLAPDNSPSTEQGLTQEPLPVSDETKQLQREAAHHKAQADGYTQGLSSVQKDEQAMFAGAAISADEMVRRRDEHSKLYSEAMNKLRKQPIGDGFKEHSVFPRQKKAKRTEAQDAPVDAGDAEKARLQKEAEGIVNKLTQR